MSFCVVCGKQFKKGHKVLNLEAGEITGDNGRDYCESTRIKIHWLCFLGMIETIKTVGDDQ